MSEPTMTRCDQCEGTGSFTADHSGDICETCEGLGFIQTMQYRVVWRCPVAGEFVLDDEGDAVECANNFSHPIWVVLE